MVGSSGRRWFWWASGVPLLLLLAASSFFVRQVDGFHATSQCVQLGQANMNTRTSGSVLTYSLYYRWGYWTIGTRKFDTKYAFLDFTYGFKSSGGRRKRSTRVTRQTCMGTTDQLVAKPSGNTACPYNWQSTLKPSIDLCPMNEVNIRTYAVNEVVNSSYSRVLHGWLYVEIEITDQSDEILGVYVQMRDEFFNAIGEFVGNPKEQCPTAGATQKEKEEKDKTFGQPTAFQILPCSAVGFREAKVSNALFMARKEMLKEPLVDGVNWAEVLPPDDQPKRGIRFTWRLSEYWCNRHLRFRPEAIIFTKNMALGDDRYKHPIIMRKAADYWIRHKWYGAADIKRENTKLACDDEAIDYTTGKLMTKGGKLVAPWLLDKSVKSIMENDYMHKDQWDCDKNTRFHMLKSCHANTRNTKPKPSDPDPNPDNVQDTVPSFAGRCTHHFEKTPSHEALQGCNLDVKGEEFEDVLNQYPNLPTYSDYVNELYVNRTRLCSVPCVPPNVSDPSHLDTIKGYEDRSGEKDFTQITVYNLDSRKENKYEQAYVGRKYHGAMSLIWSMFLVPVGIFIARYLKETYMTVTCTGIHLWFWVHFGFALMGAGLMVSSVVGLVHSMDTWGRNQDPMGVNHRIFGYLSLTLCGLMIWLGGFRGMQRTTRYVTFTVHSVLGFSIHICNMMVVLFSAFIPASPAMGDNCDNHGNPTDVGPIFYVIIAFIVIEVAFHIGMTVLQVMKDRRYGITRPWFCPIIPILPHDSTEDLVGSGVRKVMMLAHVLISLIMTNTAVGLLMAHEPANRTCLTLTGKSDCENPWGCSSIAMAYFNKITSERNTSGSYTIVDRA